MTSRKLVQTRDMQAIRAQELLGERGPKEKRAVRFGDMDTMMGDYLKVAKKTATEEARRAAAEVKSTYGVATFTVTDVAITTNDIDGSPRVIMSQTVSGFGAGGFTASFEGYLDNSSGLDGQFATVDLLVNGVRVGRVRAGLRASAGTVRAMFPVSLTTAFNTPEAEPSVEIQAFTSNLDGDTTGAMTFTLKQCRLVVSGAQ